MQGCIVVYMSTYNDMVRISEHVSTYVHMFYILYISSEHEFMCTYDDVRIVHMFYQGRIQ